MVPRENCVICLKKIYRSRRGGQFNERRGKNALTCSRKCSKIYNRVVCFFKNRKELNYD